MLIRSLTYCMDRDSHNSELIFTGKGKTVNEKSRLWKIRHVFIMSSALLKETALHAR